MTAPVDRAWTGPAEAKPATSRVVRMRSSSRLAARVGLVLLVAASAASAGPRGLAELRDADSAARCVATARGHAVYVGDSSRLAVCLERLKMDRIAELRITSGGGDAVATLRDMRRYLGRIDLLVVERLCASSCANYVVPAARRLRVEPDSYLLLHGSISQRDFDGQAKAVREQLREQLRPHGGGMHGADLERRLDEELEAIRRQVGVEAEVQQSFARARLRCDDWLDVKRHVPEGLPGETQWLLVTPQMAQRCLKVTRLAAYWPPEPGDQFAPELGIFRARR